MILAKNLETPFQPRSLALCSLCPFVTSVLKSFMFLFALAHRPSGGELCFLVSPLESGLPQTSRNCGIQTTCKNANPFRIRTSQKQGGGVPHSNAFPPSLRSAPRCLRGNLHPSLSLRWSPVVFQRKTHSISFLFISLQSFFLLDEGVHPSPQDSVPVRIFSRPGLEHDVLLSNCIGHGFQVRVCRSRSLRRGRLAGG
jgi:hypothetical protein